MANDKSFNNYAYLVFKQYSFPLTFRALSECAFKQHVQSIHWGATTILKWQVCNICQTLSERSKKVGDGICDLLLYLTPRKIFIPSIFATVSCLKIEGGESCKLKRKQQFFLDIW